MPVVVATPSHKIDTAVLVDLLCLSMLSEFANSKDARPAINCMSLAQNLTAAFEALIEQQNGRACDTVRLKELDADSAEETREEVAALRKLAVVD